MYFCCTEKKESFFGQDCQCFTKHYYTIIQNSEDKNKDRCIKKSFLLLLLKVKPTWTRTGLFFKNTVLPNDIKNLEKFQKFS